MSFALAANAIACWHRVGISVRASKQSSNNIRGPSPCLASQDDTSTETSMADMMAKLAAAEAEAEKLRSELKQSAAAPVEDLSSQTPAKPKSRIDGVGGRELLFGTSTKPGDAWLKDGMEFLVREQPSEGAELVGMSTEEQNTVNRRLAIGLFGTALFAGLAQIDLDSLEQTPSKPLFFYLVPLLKNRELLKRASELAENGYWEDLTIVVNQIQTQNDARGNLSFAATFLTGRDEERAKQAASDFLELLEKVDYNKYFESMKGVPVTGAKALEYSKFSKKAAVAAGAKLDEFLGLMDREQLDAAKSQVETFVPATVNVPPSLEVEISGESTAGEGSTDNSSGNTRSFSDGYGQ